MLRTLLVRRKKVIFIVPFVSLVIEKARWLQAVFGAARLRVRAFHGNKGGTSIGGADVAVCTLERANGLINHMLFEDKLQQLG
jgi:DNA polymerase theta